MGISGRKEWITPETWTVIEEKRTLKKRMSEAKSKRLKESLKVKRLVRKDKRNHLDELTSAAEKAAADNQHGALYCITTP